MAINKIWDKRKASRKIRKKEVEDDRKAKAIRDRERAKMEKKHVKQAKADFDATAEGQP